MGTETTRLKLYKPTIGERNYGEEVNENFDTLDDIRLETDIREFLPSGFVSDGSVDYTTEIQSAKDEGGVTKFPLGTWVCTSSWTYNQDTHIVGMGQGTIIDNQSGDYAFKNVMIANSGFVTFEKMKIIGSSDATAQGGIYIGDGSGGSYAPSQYSLRDIFIDNFQKSGAIGIYLENPSDVSFDNVKIGSIGSGTGLVVRGTRINTGVFAFNNCTFGGGTTDLGAEIGRSGDTAPVDSIIFNGCFLKGTTASLKIFGRTVNFIGSHFEVGSGATQFILTDSWVGGGVKGCTFTGDGTDPDYGIYVPSGDAIVGVEISNNEFTNLLVSGAVIKIEATGNDVQNVLVANNRIRTTTPAILSDASGNVRLQQVYDTDNSDNATSGTGPDNLASTTILAGYLGVTGGIKIKAAGTKTNGASENKILALVVGAGTAINVLLNVTTDTDWRLEATIVNTATNAQRISWICHDGTTVTQGYDTASEDTTANMVVKLRGDVAATGTDVITQTMWSIESI